MNFSLNCASFSIHLSKSTFLTFLEKLNNAEWKKTLTTSTQQQSHNRLNKVETDKRSHI